LTVGELFIDGLLKILLSVLPIYAENICASQPIFHFSLSVLLLAALKNQTVSEHMIAFKNFHK